MAPILVLGSRNCGLQCNTLCSCRAVGSQRREWMRRASFGQIRIVDLCVQVPELLSTIQAQTVACVFSPRCVAICMLSASIARHTLATHFGNTLWQDTNRRKRIGTNHRSARSLGAMGTINKPVHLLGTLHRQQERLNDHVTIVFDRRSCVCGGR